MLSLKHILVATDFTETSTRAVTYAFDLAQKLEVPLTLAHAYEIPVYGFPDGALIATADITARIAKGAQEALHRAVESIQGKGVKVAGVLRTGVPWEEINSTAAEVGADLIVIGTHGRRGLSRALLGSVAENVVRTAKVPVLTIHGPRES